MTDFADDLAKRLDQTMVPPQWATASQGRSDAMTQALARVERYFNSADAGSTTDRQTVAEALLRFRTSRVLNGYQQTRYVCVGASQKLFDWCLLEDHELLEVVLKRARESSDRHRLKYFACLLCSFWSFPWDQNETSPASRIGWLRLRSWLNGQRLFLDRAIKNKPFWFSTLNGHANLLTHQPCQRYGQELLEGVSAALNSVFETLGIPPDSWLRKEAVSTQMAEAARLSDTDFQSRVPHLIEVSTGKTDFKISRDIATRCLAMIVSRYAVCSCTPEHIPLRDAAIEFIGNPWCHRASWESCVLDKDGRPDDRAREMVNGWLKVRLIKGFFDLLSEEQSSDSRRLNYWLRFETMIQDMWFALGTDALNDPRPEYSEFRRRADGRLLNLTGATPTPNNAFLMHLGEYLVIEFGIPGNACFVYKYDRLPLGIKCRLGGGDERAAVDIEELKAPRREARLLHNGSWEQSFDAAICPLLKFAPSTVS